MRPNLYILIAVITASVIPAFIFTVASMFFDSGFRGWAIVIFPFVLLATFAHSALLGFPFFLLLRRFNMLHWRPFVFGGFVIGVLPSLIFALFRKVDLFKNDSFNSLQGIAGAGILGAMGALLFWLVWNYLSGRRTG
jgi:hypothetical protein